MKDLVVTIAHDYQCPWSWLAFFQAQRLQTECPQLKLDWQGYELLPDGASELAQRPQPSERFKQLAQLDDLPLPTEWPGIITTHNALEGAEYLKNKQPELFNRYNEAVYRAFWEKDEDISDLKVLEKIGKSISADADAFLQAITVKQFADKIVPFDEPAYVTGIRRVTTFKFLGEQCAEAPYATISEMAKRFIAWYER